MNSSPSSSANAVQTFIPNDLGEWASDIEIVRHVLDATHQVTWPDQGRFKNWDGTVHRSATILTVLTYCYCRGILPSDEIWKRMHQDGIVNYLCCNDAPAEHALRWFRRKHIATIENTITRVFERIWLSQISRQAGVRLEPSAHNSPAFAAEAQRRVRLAVQFDSMAAD